jgi:hypothetical protein
VMHPKRHIIVPYRQCLVGSWKVCIVCHQQVISAMVFLKEKRGWA